MEDTYESETIFEDRHYGSRLSSFEFMPSGHNNVKRGKEPAEHPDDYLP